jgi:hypothetical protein
MEHNSTFKTHPLLLQQHRSKHIFHEIIKAYKPVGDGCSPCSDINEGDVTKIKSMKMIQNGLFINSAYITRLQK